MQRDVSGFKYEPIKDDLTKKLSQYKQRAKNVPFTCTGFMYFILLIILLIDSGIPALPETKGEKAH